MSVKPTSFDFDDTPAPVGRNRAGSVRQQLIHNLRQLTPGKCLRVCALHLTAAVLGQAVRSQAYRMKIKVVVRADGPHAVRIWLREEGGIRQ